MKLGLLFHRRQTLSHLPTKREPVLGASSTSLMSGDAWTERVEPVLAAEPVPAHPPFPALPAVAQLPPVRQMSPRQMANWAQEMYLAGALSWQEFRAAIPAELHPDYNRTVGALTGQRAQPDRPRDMLKEWEDRLAFVRRHIVWDEDELRRAEHIVALLRQQANPSQWANG